MKQKGWHSKAFLMSLDLIGAMIAFCMANWMEVSNGMLPQNAVTAFVRCMELYLYSIPVLLVVFQTAGLYDRHGLFQGTVEYTMVLKSCIIFIFGVIVVSFITDKPSPSRTWLLVTWALCVLFISLNRFIRRLMRTIFKARYTPEKVLILGASEDSRGIAERLEQSGTIEVVGFLDDFGPQGGEVWKGKRVLGAPSSYRDVARNTGATLAVLVPDANSWETRRDVLIQSALANDIELQIAPGLSDLHLVSMKVGFRGSVPLLRFRPGYVSGLDSVAKFILDYLLAIVLLMLTAPIMLTFGLLLWMRDGRRVIERFEVIGKHGMLFRTYKFRTGQESASSYRSFRRMVPIADGDKQPGKIERFLFHTGLDKLPQIFNVLMGKMSIVGPRTISPPISKRYARWLHSILAVKPGIIGSWALDDTGDLEHEISLTLHYVRNWNLWADLVIICQTACEVLRTRFRTKLQMSA